MASGTTSSCSESTKTTSFRSYDSTLSRTPSSLSHQNSANDVVVVVHHLNCANGTATTTTKHCFSSQCVSTLASANKQMISCLAAHGRLLYAASGGKINVFDLSTFSLVDTFNGGGNGIPSSGLVKSIAFDGESGNVFTAHQDHRIRVWKLKRSKRHRLVKTLPTLKDRLCRFAIPKNYVVVRRHKRRLWIEHNDAVSGLAANDGLLYSVSWDRTLKVWKASESKCMESVLGAHDDAINAVEASTAGDGAVYTASADGTIKVWQRGGASEARGVALVAELRRDNACAVNALALARDGMTLLSGSCEGEVVAWGRGTGEGPDRMRARAALSGHDGAVLCIVAVDRGVFASGSADRTVRIWGECGDGFCCLGVLDGHRKPVRSLAAVEDEDRDGVVSVVSGSLDGEVKIWRVTVYNGNYDINCASY
ncbi:hypothetical protein V2J09_006850 [Rumex salicifolius]